MVIFSYMLGLWPKAAKLEDYPTTKEYAKVEGTNIENMNTS